MTYNALPSHYRKLGCKKSETDWQKKSQVDGNIIAGSTTFFLEIQRLDDDWEVSS